MSLSSLTDSNLKLVFALLGSLTNVVFWVRSSDYKKQIYVSEGFESLWGYSTQFLYENPDQWFETLTEEPEHETNWLTERATNNYTSAAIFQIKRSDGQLCWIKDQSTLLVDDKQQKLAVIGLGEYITDEQMNQLKSTPNVWQESPYFCQFSQLFCREFKTSLTSFSNPLSQSTVPEESGKFIHCNGKEIWVSRREFHVLELLFKGLSAKQTAWELGISVRTVETYLNSLRKKTGCRTKLSLLGQLVLKN